MGAILLGLGRLILAPLLNPEVWPAMVLLAALCWGVGWFKGDAHGDAQCEARIATERAKQTEAVEEAGAELKAEIERLKHELDEKDIQIATLDAEGDAAGDAHACGLGLDSVRRVNRSRSR